MISVLRQIRRYADNKTYAAFVDLTKAFDTDNRDGLWKILARLGCPPKFLTILRRLHEGQQGQVKHNGSLSGSFPISNGVKQGCIAELLFAYDCALLAHTEEALQHFVNRFSDAAESFAGITISLKKTEVSY